MLRLISVTLGDVVYTSQKSLKIMKEDPELLLNKRSELVSKCRHKSKFTLANIKYSFLYDMYRHWK